MQDPCQTMGPARGGPFRYVPGVKLAVVIPALCEADRIRAAVASAMCPDVDVLVVDGGSTDSTRTHAVKAGARVAVGPKGRARQLAQGLASTSAEIVLFLHADTCLPRGWEREVESALEDLEVVGGAFRFRFDDRAFCFRWIEWGVKIRLFLFGLPYGDQAIFARRSVLRKIGGIPDVPIMEDLDLVRRLKRCGTFRLLESFVVTAARRYTEKGPFRLCLRNVVALLAWYLGVNRARVARWYGS